jgi:hypothetical protein
MTEPVCWTRLHRNSDRIHYSQVRYLYFGFAAVQICRFAVSFLAIHKDPFRCRRKPRNALRFERSTIRAPNSGYWRQLIMLIMGKCEPSVMRRRRCVRVGWRNLRVQGMVMVESGGDDLSSRCEIICFNCPGRVAIHATGRSCLLTRSAKRLLPLLRLSDCL